MKSLVLLSALCFLFGSPSLAQTESKMLMKTFSVTAAFSLPPWSSNEDISETSELFRDQGKSNVGHDLFIWEVIPKGESFDDWTKLYAITAEHPLTGDLEHYANGQINRIFRACYSSKVQFIETASEKTKLFVVFCESYKNQPDTGEISFSICNWRIRRWSRITSILGFRNSL